MLPRSRAAADARLDAAVAAAALLGAGTALAYPTLIVVGAVGAGVAADAFDAGAAIAATGVLTALSGLVVQARPWGRP